MTSRTCCWTRPVSLLMRMTRSRLVIKCSGRRFYTNSHTDNSRYTARQPLGQDRKLQRVPSVFYPRPCRGLENLRHLSSAESRFIAVGLGPTGFNVLAADSYLQGTIANV